MTISRSVNPARSLLGSLLLFGSSACVLTGIEPDEIDLAVETETGVNTTSSADDATGEGDASEGNEDPTTTGDGDPSGDGDGDPSGDGDGDQSDTGDGDGDPTGTGDGDGDGDDTCLGFSPTELLDGENPVGIVDGASAVSTSCGGAGPETVYRFTAPATGDWQFAVEQPEFTEVLTLVGSCEPLDELVCSGAPAVLQQFLNQGQVVFVILDSEAGTGTATLNISLL